ncbi:MAG: hypothetical protein WC331_11505, partial [Candidatus Omnitrophota bacterium]
MIEDALDASLNLIQGRIFDRIYDVVHPSYDSEFKDLRGLTFVKQTPSDPKNYTIPGLNGEIFVLAGGQLAGCLFNLFKSFIVQLKSLPVLSSGRPREIHFIADAVYYQNSPYGIDGYQRLQETFGLVYRPFLDRSGLAYERVREDAPEADLGSIGPAVTIYTWPSHGEFLKYIRPIVRNTDTIPVFSSPASQAVTEVLESVALWKRLNAATLDDRSDKNPFATKLQEYASGLYEARGLYAWPIHDRRLYVQAIFDAKRYPRVAATLEELFQRFAAGFVTGNTSAFLPQLYYELASALSDMESAFSILDNRNIRYGVNLLFDFWDREKRIFELFYLTHAIEDELRQPGSGRLPLIAAMQDLHGGAARARSLVGFVLGLPADAYTKIGSLGDLRSHLAASGIDARRQAARFIGLNDKYDRGSDPQGVFELVRWLRDAGKLKPFIGNHELWRTLAVLGVHFLFEANGIDYTAKDVKNHHVAYWLREAFRHAGWGDVELTQLNQERFNAALRTINAILQLHRLRPFDTVDLFFIQGRFSEEIKRLKDENAVIRARNELNRDNPAYTRQQELPLPDIFAQTLVYLRQVKDAYNARIAALNQQLAADIPLIDFEEVNLDNFWRDPVIIERTLWELKNFRLFYVDVLGNLHMHNIVPIDYEKGGFAVAYKGLSGLPALELMAEDIRSFFQDVTDLPDSMVFRRKMWEALGEAFTIINGWYSDIDAHAKAVAVKNFVDRGGLEGLGHEILGHIAQVFVDRESSLFVIWGHNERKKFEGDKTALPWIVLYPALNSGIANIDYEMSEGYSDRGAVLTFFKRDDAGAITGMRKWGYRKGSAVIEDLTFEDTQGLTSEQLTMLEMLADGQGFMRWYRRKALHQIIEESQSLIRRAREAARID